MWCRTRRIVTSRDRVVDPRWTAAVPEDGCPPINQPLQDLRVIDLCHGRGDLCGRLLGDLGADVLLVEPPTGSTSRHLPPFGTDGTSLYFAYRNTNKRSAVLDLSNQVDRDRLLSLTARADVVVESSPPGHLAGLGIEIGRAHV